MKKIICTLLILLISNLLTHQSYAHIYRVNDTCAEALGFGEDLRTFYAQRDEFWKVPSYNNVDRLMLLYHNLYKKTDAMFNPPLHIAAQAADLSEINRLVFKGMPVDIRGQRGVTPLAVAATYDHVNAIDLLLDLGADINAPDAIGLSPLSYAALRGNISATRRLLERRANINHRNLLNETPIVYAVRSGNINMFRTLASMGASLTLTDVRGFTLLYIAIFYPEVKNRTAMIEIILDKTANWQPKPEIINRPEPVYGATPLHLAAYKGYTDVIEILLQRGASLTTINKRGEFPIHVAARSDQAGAFLMLRDADPTLLDTRDSKGQTPIESARKWEAQKVLSALGL